MEIKSLPIAFLIFCIMGCTGSNRTIPVLASQDSQFGDTAKSIKTHDPIQPVAKHDPAKEWLVQIFDCEHGTQEKYCYNLAQEDTLCTARFKEFLHDSNEIYGPTNLTEAELVEAESRYKAKWAKIYSLYTQEMWLFGRGNDDPLHVNSIEVKELSDNRYTLTIDFADHIKTMNEVQLVQENNAYRIDYCKTTFID
ncbi:hypothetical protein HX021_03270 [Sphingobacterium sp. N143]|uniref:hypothetical protein n=1 Tax=Sphingobacterium sp. N143 TaxID=2746727 RepID=UPI002576EB60|nr:hypothetical protein [Sphingobacterium sp. N143]MDM1293312.1 hypothetical protein [Sphingobacterium sp. N143]